VQAEQAAAEALTKEPAEHVRQVLMPGAELVPAVQGLKTWVENAKLYLADTEESTVDSSTSLEPHVTVTLKPKILVWQSSARL